MPSPHSEKISELSTQLCTDFYPFWRTFMQEPPDATHREAQEKLTEIYRIFFQKELGVFAAIMSSATLHWFARQSGHTECPQVTNNRQLIEHQPGRLVIAYVFMHTPDGKGVTMHSTFQYPTREFSVDRLCRDALACWDPEKARMTDDQRHVAWQAERAKLEMANKSDAKEKFLANAPDMLADMQNPKSEYYKEKAREAGEPIPVVTVANLPDDMGKKGKKG